MSQSKSYIKNFIPSKKCFTFSTTKSEPFNMWTPYYPANTPVITMEQTHSNNSQVVDSNNLKKPFLNTDALITTEKNILLTVKTADCLPIIIFHPNPLIAVIHAGREGTKSDITKKTIDKIKKLSLAHGIFSIWMGPCICKNCYEINKKPKTHFDLITENIIQIKTILNKKEFNIIHSHYCTSCDNDQFFSYRKEKKTEKRNISAIMLR